MTGQGEAHRLTPFHVAVPVRDIAAARRFYGELLGCAEGRSDANWVDFDLFGHQFVCHLQPDGGPVQITNAVDGDAVPVPHYGVVLRMEQWEKLRDRLASAGVEFVVGPRVRFAGQAGEQGTFFVRDPSGNALEFKGFRDLGRLFDPT